MEPRERAGVQATDQKIWEGGIRGIQRDARCALGKAVRGFSGLAPRGIDGRGNSKLAFGVDEAQRPHSTERREIWGRHGGRDSRERGEKIRRASAEGRGPSCDGVVGKRRAGEGGGNWVDRGGKRFAGREGREKQWCWGGGRRKGIREVHRTREQGKEREQMREMGAKEKGRRCRCGRRGTGQRWRMIKGGDG